MRKPKQSVKPATRRGRRPGPSAARSYPNRIHELGQARKLTYAAIAEAADTHWTTIARLATGKQELTHTWMKRLGKVFAVDPAAIITGSARPMRMIKVKGRLQAGAWAESHELSDEEQYEVSIADDASLRDLQLYAGEISGESMNQRYPNRSIVILSRITQRPGDIAVGKRYHVRLTRPDGQTEETIKTLARGEDGRFWLRPESNHPEHQEWLPLDGKPGATVELLGRVRFVVHRED